MTSSRPMTVTFRVDASLDIGTGHVMRCLTLADALAASGAECRFICREHPGNLIEQIRSKDHCVHALPADAASPEAYDNASPDHAAWLGCHWETDAAQTKAILIDEAPNWLVADHYALDARWESALEGCYGKLMVIDDLADRPHDCDLLLDQNLGREPEDYEALIPARCQRLIGPRYALLRPEFAALRAYSLQRRQTPELKRLLITMGGVDQPNATGKVLEALKSCALPSDCQITVVMGPAAPWLEPVRALASSMPWPTEVLVNVSNMAQIMANSDLAIGAAGSTSWERCCLGLPTLLITLAENQRAGAQALHQAGAARWLGEPEAIPHELAAALPMLLGGQLVAEMSQAARGLTEGRGAARVLQKMECLA